MACSGRAAAGQYDVYLICAEVENTTARNDYFYPDYDLCSIGGEYDYELLESSVLMPASYGYSFYLPAGETVRCRFLILADKQAEDVEVSDGHLSAPSFLPDLIFCCNVCFIKKEAQTKFVCSFFAGLMPVGV